MRNASSGTRSFAVNAGNTIWQLTGGTAPFALVIDRTNSGVMIAGIAAHDTYHAGQIRLLQTLRKRG